MAQTQPQATDPLAGFLNHLNPSQEKAFADFKELLISKSLYIPATGNQKPSHDDTALLNFLRGRKFDIVGAHKQFATSEAWRRDHKIDSVFEGIDIHQFKESAFMYPQWTGRLDKRGVPIHYYEVAPLNSAKVSAYYRSASKTTIVPPPAQKGPHDYIAPPKPDGVADLPKTTTKTDPRLLRLFALYEYQQHFTSHISSAQSRPNPEVPICQGATIADISNVGLKQFWNLRSHMQEVSVLLNANYPETLDWIFIIGAPAFFPVVWGWIKNWFDPTTVSKISILSAGEVLPTLEKHIEIEDIMERFGGKLSFKYGDDPNLSPKIIDSLIWEEGVEHRLPNGPLRVEEATSKTGENGLKELWAIGSENGVRRRIKLATIQDTSKSKDIIRPQQTLTTEQLNQGEDEEEDDFVEAKETLSNDILHEKMNGLDVNNDQIPQSKQAIAA
ncbi:MAG: hypothetical protein M1814_006602 [Vezdaea aestivalis]|nr:MAG: hypothetical protein M1814_006602 [Vezdaea aestivalis]